MERKLASPVIIDALDPIPGADLIEVATVKGWKLVVKKGEFVVGGHAVYCEIDSFLPVKPEFEFLRKSSYRKYGDIEGFRLKTIKLRGQISQGLLLPISILGDYEYTLDEDVSELLGIIKYDPPVPVSLTGISKGNFPSFIPKTDEDRIQNLSGKYKALKEHTYYVTEKLEGSSITFYYNNGTFGVCSRNLDLLEDYENSFWKAAKQLDIENKLRVLGLMGKNYAIQGELIGSGIQGNIYNLKTQAVKFFNAFDIDKQEYLNFKDFNLLITKVLELETVPIIHDVYKLPESIEHMILIADGESYLSPFGTSVAREGLVVRSHDRKVSFKAISNKYLLNEKA